MGETVNNKPVRDPQPGSVSWQIEFYEDILKRNPNYVEVLMLLAGLYTDSKMYKKGLGVDQKLATLRCDDPIVQYNLACSYSLVHDTDKSVKALKKAVELGYFDADHIEEDPDLDGIRHDPRYTDLMSKIKTSRARSAN